MITVSHLYKYVILNRKFIKTRKLNDIEGRIKAHTHEIFEDEYEIGGEWDNLGKLWEISEKFIGNLIESRNFQYYSYQLAGAVICVTLQLQSSYCSFFPCHHLVFHRGCKLHLFCDLWPQSGNYPQASVYRWYNEFKSGRKSTELMSGPGTPTMGLTKKIINTGKTITFSILI